jgi:hypothetical protein
VVSIKMPSNTRSEFTLTVETGNWNQLATFKKQN